MRARYGGPAECFRAVDADGEGTVSRTELVAGLARVRARARCAQRGCGRARLRAQSGGGGGGGGAAEAEAEAERAFELL
jgi:hypothetical protein